MREDGLMYCSVLQVLLPVMSKTLLPQHHRRYLDADEDTRKKHIAITASGPVPGGVLQTIGGAYSMSNEVEEPDGLLRRYLVQIFAMLGAVVGVGQETHVSPTCDTLGSYAQSAIDDTSVFHQCVRALFLRRSEFVAELDDQSAHADEEVSDIDSDSDGDNPQIQCGHKYWYWDSAQGEEREVKVLSVDKTVEPPSYGVQFSVGGGQRETEGHRLSLKKTTVSVDLGAPKMPKLADLRDAPTALRETCSVWTAVNVARKIRNQRMVTGAPGFISRAVRNSDRRKVSKVLVTLGLGVSRTAQQTADARRDQEVESGEVHLEPGDMIIGGFDNMVGSLSHLALFVRCLQFG